MYQKIYVIVLSIFLCCTPYAFSTNCIFSEEEILKVKELPVKELNSLLEEVFKNKRNTNLYYYMENLLPERLEEMTRAFVFGNIEETPIPYLKLAPTQPQMIKELSCLVIESIKSY